MQLETKRSVREMTHGQVLILLACKLVTAKKSPALQNFTREVILRVALQNQVVIVKPKRFWAQQ